MILTLLLFVALGIIAGLYYGKHDNDIFHYPYKDKKDGKNEKTQEHYFPLYLQDGKIKKIYAPKLNNNAKLHNLWIHLFCGFIGATAMYTVFTNKICLSNFTFKTFDWPDFVLLLIGTLGYVGLLPRTLWFFASKGNSLKIK